MAGLGEEYQLLREGKLWLLYAISTDQYVGLPQEIEEDDSLKLHGNVLKTVKHGMYRIRKVDGIISLKQILIAGIESSEGNLKSADNQTSQQETVVTSKLDSLTLKQTSQKETTTVKGNANDNNAKDSSIGPSQGEGSRKKSKKLDSQGFPLSTKVGKPRGGNLLIFYEGESSASSTEDLAQVEEDEDNASRSEDSTFDVTVGSVVSENVTSYVVKVPVVADKVSCHGEISGRRQVGYLASSEFMSDEVRIGSVKLYAQLGQMTSLPGDCVVYLWSRKQLHEVEMMDHPLLSQVGDVIRQQWAKHRVSKDKYRAFSTSGGDLDIPLIVHVPCKDSPSGLERGFTEGLMWADQQQMKSLVIPFHVDHPFLCHKERLAAGLLSAVTQLSTPLVYVNDVSIIVEEETGVFTRLSEPFNSYKGSLQDHHSDEEDSNKGFEKINETDSKSEHHLAGHVGKSASFLPPHILASPDVAAKQPTLLKKVGKKWKPESNQQDSDNIYMKTPEPDQECEKYSTTIGVDQPGHVSLPVHSMIPSLHVAGPDVTANKPAWYDGAGLKKIGRRWVLKVDGKSAMLPGVLAKSEKQLEIAGGYIISDDNIYEVKKDANGKIEIVAVDEAKIKSKTTSVQDEAEKKLAPAQYQSVKESNGGMDAQKGGGPRESKKFEPQVPQFLKNCAGVPYDYQAAPGIPPHMSQFGYQQQGNSPRPGSAYGQQPSYEEDYSNVDGEFYDPDTDGDYYISDQNFIPDWLFGHKAGVEGKSTITYSPHNQPRGMAPGNAGAFVNALRGQSIQYGGFQQQTPAGLQQPQAPQMPGPGFFSQNSQQNVQPPVQQTQPGMMIPGQGHAGTPGVAKPTSSPDLVDVKTGEEDEDQFFCERAKLFRFDSEANQWKERGIGEMKILRHKQSKKLRILMRREQVLKLCANHFVNKEMKLTPIASSDRAWVWTAQDFAEEEMKQEKFAVKFKTEDLAEKFKQVFIKYQAEIDDGSKSDESPVKDKKAATGSIFGNPSGTPASSGLFGTKSSTSTEGTGKGFAFGGDAAEKKSDSFVFGSPQKTAFQGFKFTLKPEPDAEKQAAQPAQLGSGFHFALKPTSTPVKSPIKSPGPKSPEITEDGLYLNKDGDDAHIHFDPIIELPEQVEVKTGEEDEETIFSHRAKLYRFVNGEWKKRGLGDVKVLFNREEKKARILMRREQILKLCCNHYITPGLKFQPMPNNKDCALVWYAMDFADDEPKNEQFSIKFKSPDIATKFESAVEDAKARIECEIDKSNKKSAHVETIGKTSDKSVDNDEVIFVKEETATDEQISQARKYQLPDNFYLYEKCEPCPGCRGCHDLMLGEESGADGEDDDDEYEDVESEEEDDEYDEEEEEEEDQDGGDDLFTAPPSSGAVYISRLLSTDTDHEVWIFEGVEAATICHLCLDSLGRLADLCVLIFRDSKAGVANKLTIKCPKIRESKVRECRYVIEDIKMKQLTQFATLIYDFKEVPLLKLKQFVESKETDPVLYYREACVVHVVARSFKEAEKGFHEMKFALGVIKGGRRIDRQFSSSPDSGGVSSGDLSGSRHAGGGGGAGKRGNRTFNMSDTSARSMSYPSGEFKFEQRLSNGFLLKIYKADITRLDVDVIVNAANDCLQHGEGVARVISRAAGYRLDDESRQYTDKHGYLKVAENCVTTAGNMARYKGVIHAVGPQWADYRYVYYLVWKFVYFFTELKTGTAIIY